MCAHQNLMNLVAERIPKALKYACLRLQELCCILAC